MSVLLNPPALHAGEASKPVRRVLILDSFGRNVSLTCVVDPFRAELARLWAGPVDFQEVPLESSRIENPEVDRTLADYLDHHTAGSPLHLVVPFGAPAMRFALRHRDRLFAGTPLLIAHVEQRQLESEKLPPGTVVASLVYDLPPLIDGILQVLPRTTTIAVILGSSTQENYWREEAKREFERFSARVQFRWLEGYTFEQMRGELATLPPDSAVLYAAIWRDAAGMTFEADQGFKGLKAVANAPFFSVSESEFGQGIVGGPLLPERSAGIQAAAVAARMLKGETAATLKLSPLGALPAVYDWRELQRWGISETRLPPGSTVLFRPPTILQQYRGYVIGIGAVLAVQSALIACLLWLRRRQRSTKEALALSEKRLQLITNSFPALIAHIDCEERFTFANQAYKSWFGRDPTELVGVTVRELMGERRYHKVRPYVVRALAGNEVSFSITIDQDDASALGERSIDAIHVPDRADSGEVRGFYALILDASDRVRAQMESRELLGELAHADRISMVGELAATLAHELNQPLTAIVSNAQAAARFLNGPAANVAEVREIMADIASDGTRAGEVIRRVRDLVRKGPKLEAFSPLDVNQVVIEVASLLRNDATLQRIPIELRLGLNPPLVLGDRIQLQQVVMNLLLNAFDAVEESAPRDRTVVLESRADDTEIVVSVRDHGTGISTNALSGLFEPFTSSKPHGLGMGLSISRSIVTAHSGRLWADNNPDGGASFSFTLPIPQVPADSGGVTPRHERAIAHSVRG